MLSSFSLETLKEISKYVKKLIFNIEAAREETYDAIMGTKNSFLLMQESVNRAVQASITVEAHFVPMKLNYNEIETVVELCERLHVSRVSFLRLVPHGRAKVNKSRIQLTTAEELLMVDSLSYNMEIIIYQEIDCVRTIRFQKNDQHRGFCIE